jgi:hypothetical protein
MPVISSKQHVISLARTNDQDIPLLRKQLLSNETDGRDYAFKIAKSDTQGFCVLSYDGVNVCRVDFKVLSDIPLLTGSIQIDSVFTDASYRGVGLAPLAYEQLVREFDVVSDTTQTEDGARHWQVKMSTMANVTVYLVDNFPASPAYITDENGTLLTYTYGKHDMELRIWGLDVPDHRQKIEGINHKVEDPNDDVVLVAKYSPLAQK